MDLNEYQREAEQTMNPSLSEFDMLECAVYGMMGEIGKLATLLNSQRFKDGSESIDDHIPAIRDMLGDILWYNTEGIASIDAKLEGIALENLNKIRRKYPNGR